MRKTIIAAALALGVTTVGIAAQGDPNGNPDAPGNPNILAAVQSLRADLSTAFNQVFQSLQSIQAALKTLTPAPVGSILNTTILEFVPSSTQSGEFRCWVTNVAAANRTVVIEFVEDSGAVHTTFAAAVLTPGKSTFGGLAASNQFFNRFRCRFTVQDGTKQDVLGALILNTVVFSASTATSATVSVDAR